MALRTTVHILHFNDITQSSVLLLYNRAMYMYSLSGFYNLFASKEMVGKWDIERNLTLALSLTSSPHLQQLLYIYVREVVDDQEIQ